MSSTFGCTDTLTQTVTVVEVPSSGSGQLCWVDTLSQTNANFNYGYQVLDQHVDYLGNTYVTGYVRDETAWPSSFSMFFVKYDNNGNEVWSKEQKGSDYVFGDDYSSSYGTCIATDLEGNVYVGGSFASEKLLLGSNTITFDRGIVQAFVIKYDALGNIINQVNELLIENKQLRTDNQELKYGRGSDTQLRLFKNGVGKYNDRNIHEEIAIFYILYFIFGN